MKRCRAQLNNHGNGKYDFESPLLLPSRPNNSTIVQEAKFWRKSFHSSFYPHHCWPLVELYLYETSLATISAFSSFY